MMKLAAVLVVGLGLGLAWSVRVRSRHQQVRGQGAANARPTPPSRVRKAPPEPSPREKATRALEYHVRRAEESWYRRLRVCPGCGEEGLERTTENYRSYSFAGGGGGALHDVCHRCHACGWTVERRDVVEHMSAAGPGGSPLTGRMEPSPVVEVRVLAVPPAAEVGLLWVSEGGELQQDLGSVHSPAGRAAMRLAADLWCVAQRVPLEAIPEEERARERMVVVRRCLRGATMALSAEAEADLKAITPPRET